MNATAKRIGFIGLGMMGYPMAGLLHQAGHQLIVFDVARPKTDRFLTERPGAKVAANLAAFSTVEAVIAMLPDSDAVDAVVLGQATSRGLIEILPPGAAIIDMSSSHPMRS